jgi:hypothetical protein
VRPPLPSFFDEARYVQLVDDLGTGSTAVDAPRQSAQPFAFEPACARHRGIVARCPAADEYSIVANLVADLPAFIDVRTDAGNRALGALACGMLLIDEDGVASCANPWLGGYASSRINMEQVVYSEIYAAVPEWMRMVMRNLLVLIIVRRA